MYTSSDLLFLYAETNAHVGGGDSVGAIDLAIAREKITDFPFIPSSGIKGAIRDWFRHSDQKEHVDTLFGPESDGAEHAGAAVFTDARLLLFPVRSFKGIFAWITCPMVLERLNRDFSLAGIDPKVPVPKIQDVAHVHAPSTCLLEDKEGERIILEEYAMKAERKDLNTLIDVFKSMLPNNSAYESWKQKLDTNIVVLSDDNFKHFVKHSTEVQTRIKIKSDTKTVASGALFYQENLPSESLFYTVVAAQKPFKQNGLQTADEVLSCLKKLSNQRIQIGGNESVGKGIFASTFFGGKEQ